jgi:transcriptional regulator with XRE-family HTH domain
MPKYIDPYLKDVGARIKAIRKEKKISVRDLGALCGLDYSGLSRLENGQHSARLLTLKSIADVLQMDVKDFL